MRTTISSDSTRVPPVTAERSPPDSRITGADSPVIADSSTVAMPSMTSPSLGITSPAATTHSSPTSSGAAGDLLDRPVGPSPAGRRVGRVWRNVAACALPRPSAIASAKLANSTVNHRKAATRPLNTFSARSSHRGRGRTGSSSARCRRARRTSPGCAPAARGWSLRTLSTKRPRRRCRGRTALRRGSGCRSGGAERCRRDG